MPSMDRECIASWMAATTGESGGIMRSMATASTPTVTETSTRDSSHEG
jgi:uncharacterized membrane protein YeiH